MDDKGRLCLTDMHKATGASYDQRPGEWLRQIDTMTFAAKVAEKENMGAAHIIFSQRGRNGGTFAHWVPCDTYPTSFIRESRAALPLHSSS